MVEKTKHALAILQQRSTAGNTGAGAVSGGSNAPAPELQENGIGVNAAVCSRQVKAAVDEIIARTLQDTDERIAELKRRAGISNSDCHRLTKCKFAPRSATESRPQVVGNDTNVSSIGVEY